MSAPSLPGSPSTSLLVLIYFRFVPNRRRHDIVETHFWFDIKEEPVLICVKTLQNAVLFLMFCSFVSICLRKVRLKDQEYSYGILRTLIHAHKSIS